MADANESTFYKSCPTCNGNHYVEKVLPENVLQLDGDNYMNCPICVVQNAANTDNGPVTEFK
jgi:hypothetical protein